MTLWNSNGDQANNSPKFSAESLSIGSGATAKAANNTALFQNTTPGAFKPGIVLGVESVTAAKMANTNSEGPKTTAPGWAIRRAWEGPALSLTVAGGSAFTNSMTVTLSGGSVNAVANLTTNATGGLVSATFSNTGLFPNSSVITYTYSGGNTTGVTQSVTLGGRAGRVHYETIVESSSVTSSSQTLP